MIQPTGDSQPLGRGGARDQSHNSFIILRWFPSPIRGDERKQPMFHLVPLAGSRREVTNLDRQTRCVHQFLQFSLPQSQAIPITASPIGCDQQSLSVRVQAVSLESPNSPCSRCAARLRVPVRARIRWAGRPAPGPAPAAWPPSSGVPGCGWNSGRSRWPFSASFGKNVGRRQERCSRPL